MTTAAAPPPFVDGRVFTKPLKPGVVFVSCGHDIRTGNDNSPCPFRQASYTMTRAELSSQLIDHLLYRHNVTDPNIAVSA